MSDVGPGFSFLQPIFGRQNERYCNSEAELRAALLDIGNSVSSPRSVVITQTISLSAPLYLNEKHAGMSLRFVGVAAKLIPAPGKTVNSAISFKINNSPSNPNPNGVLIYNLQARGDGVETTGTFNNIFDVNTNTPQITVLGGQTSLPDVSTSFWISNINTMFITNVVHSGGRMILLNNNVMTGCNFMNTDIFLGGGSLNIAGSNILTAVRARSVSSTTNTFSNQIVNCKFSANINTSTGNNNIIVGNMYSGTLTTAATDVATGNLNH